MQSQSNSTKRRLKVGYFQRIFAHYQGGLVTELGQHSAHDYTFYGSKEDPEGTGIKGLSDEVLATCKFEFIKTRQYGAYVAIQPSAIWHALTTKEDVLIFEGAFTHPTTWFAIAIARLRRKPVYLHTHGWLKPEKGIKLIVRKAFYNLSSGLMLYGYRAREMAVSLGFPDRKLHVILNSLDHKAMVKLREEVVDASIELRRELTEHHDLVLLAVCRVTKGKRLIQLLEASVAIKAKGQNPKIIIIGDGPEIENLKAYATEHKLDVDFLGACYDEAKISRYLMASDAMVIPGFAGLSVIHSLTYGTPVITHDNFTNHAPEVEALISDVTGFFFRENDIESLSSRLLDLKEASRDKTRTDCMRVVDSYFNPRYMRETMDAIVEGKHPTNAIPPYL